VSSRIFVPAGQVGDGVDDSMLLFDSLRRTNQGTESLGPPPFLTLDINQSETSWPWRSFVITHAQESRLFRHFFRAAFEPSLKVLA
jgi:hypothetical protein